MSKSDHYHLTPLVFGRRQDPNGAYAAVISKWVASLLTSEIDAINPNAINHKPSTNDWNRLLNGI